MSSRSVGEECKPNIFNNSAFSDGVILLRGEKEDKCKGNSRKRARSPLRRSKRIKKKSQSNGKEESKDDLDSEPESDPPATRTVNVSTGVLALHSPFFKELFSKPDKNVSISLPEGDIQHAHDVIECIYTNKLSPLLNFEDLIRILSICKRFEVDCVRSVCLRTLSEKSLSLEEGVRVLALPHIVTSHKSFVPLRKTVQRVFTSHFRTFDRIVVDDNHPLKPDLLKMSAAAWKLFLGAENAVIRCEHNVWHALEYWWKKTPAQERLKLDIVGNNIKFLFMWRCFLDNVRSSEIIEECPTIREALMDVYQCLVLKKKEREWHFDAGDFWCKRRATYRRMELFEISFEEQKIRDLGEYEDLTKYLGSVFGYPFSVEMSIHHNSTYEISIRNDDECHAALRCTVSLKNNPTAVFEVDTSEWDYDVNPKFHLNNFIFEDGKLNITVMIEQPLYIFYDEKELF